MNSPEALPLDHWTNYLKLAQMGMLRIDQLFQKSQALVDQGLPSEAVQLHLAYATQSVSEKRHMALYNLGSLQQAQGDMPGAEASYRACIALDPNLGQAIVNLGLLLEKTGRYQEALEQWHLAANPIEGGLSYDTDIQTMALNYIGCVYENHKQYAEAERALELSLALNTKQTGVLQHWIHIRQKACTWPVFKPLPGITHNDMLMATSPLAMLAMTDDPVQQLLTAHAFVGRTQGFKEEFLCKGRVYRHDRIRIGYVSGDLCTHAVGLLLPEVFEGHDRSQFEVYAYDFSPEDGTAVRTRLKASFDHFRHINTLTDRQVAELVLQDEIDILIDLQGLSSGARPGIFALHPAPKQGTYLGFIGTTGMPWFDFVIADKYVLPEELIPYFTEKPLYVEGSFIPIHPDSDPEVSVHRAEFGLPEDAFVMTAFVNVYKINTTMFGCWMRLLRRIPHSLLWLMDDNPSTTESLKAEAQKHGIDANRLVFTTRSSHSQYRAKLALSDVFLDSYPYNCGSITRDVLNAGLPLVTVRGKTMVSRMGGSILTALNLGDFIANDIQAYEDIVVRISRSTLDLNIIKENLKQQISNLQLKPQRLTQSIEKGLLTIHNECYVPKVEVLPSYLVIRQLAMGDVLLTTPIVRQLYKDHGGHCNIDVLTMKPEIFANNPYVRQVFTPQNISIDNTHYTRVINLDLAYENLPHQHIVDAYATVSHGTPDKVEDKRLELFPTEGDRLRAKSLINSQIMGQYAVIHMRKDTWPSRNLPESTWRAIIDLLINTTDLKIVQVGSTHEISFDHHDRLLNFMGLVNIHELREIISGAECYLGIDSGTLHVAACTETPIIAMFSSAHHRLRKPLDRPSHASFIPIQPHIDCYGCQEHYPPPITGVICHRGDPYSPPCKDAFHIEDIAHSLTDLGLARASIN